MRSAARSGGFPTGVRVGQRAAWYPAELVKSRIAAHSLELGSGLITRVSGVPDLTHCIYASAAKRRFESAELTALLQAARQHNERAGLSGMLLYTEGSFFQVLEGTPDAVEALYANFELDRRHDRVTKIVNEAIPRRSFAHWTMGFSQVSINALFVKQF